MNIYDESDVPVEFVEPQTIECAGQAADVGTYGGVRIVKTQVSGALERIRLPGGYYLEADGLYRQDGEQLFYDGPWAGEGWSLEFAAAMQPAAAVPLDAEALHHSKIDSQVLLAAKNMLEADKQVQPEWLWWSHDSPPKSSPTFGRWSKTLGGVPYIRADLFLAALATPPAAPDTAPAEVMHSTHLDDGDKQTVRRRLIEFIDRYISGACFDDSEFAAEWRILRKVVAQRTPQPATIIPTQL